jgi:hypothetical protein
LLKKTHQNFDITRLIGKKNSLVMITWLKEKMKRKNKSSIVEILQTLTLGQLETKKNHTFFFLFFLFLQYSGGTSKMFNFVGCSMNAM